MLFNLEYILYKMVAKMVWEAEEILVRMSPLIRLTISFWQHPVQPIIITC